MGAGSLKRPVTDEIALPHERDRSSNLDALATGGAALIDVAPRSVRADKGDGLDVLVVQDAVHCVVRPVHNVQHASAQVSALNSRLCRASHAQLFAHSCPLCKLA
jgi:hypothetical protein